MCPVEVRTGDNDSYTLHERFIQPHSRLTFRTRLHPRLHLGLIMFDPIQGLIPMFAPAVTPYKFGVTIYLGLCRRMMYQRSYVNVIIRLLKTQRACEEKRHVARHLD